MNPSLSATHDPFSLRGVAAETVRPLSAIAATRGGGVPEARICRVFLDLVGLLVARHASGTPHGDISCNTIALDSSGQADLLLPACKTLRNADEVALRHGKPSGFNAFEQYTQDPNWPVGPWTDVYALAAVAYRLVTGQPPPAAIDRCIQDPYIALVGRGLEGYSYAFLSAIDSGLALRPVDRPQDVPALLHAMGVDNEVVIAASTTALFTGALPLETASRPEASGAARSGAGAGHSGETPAVQWVEAGSAGPAAAEQITRAARTANRRVGSNRSAIGSGALAFAARHAADAQHRMPRWLYVPAGLALAVAAVLIWLFVTNPALPKNRLVPAGSATTANVDRKDASASGNQSQPIARSDGAISVDAVLPVGVGDARVIWDDTAGNGNGNYARVDGLAANQSASPTATTTAPVEPTSDSAHSPSDHPRSEPSPAEPAGLARAESAAAPPALAAPVQSVSVNVEPWGEVFVNGIKQGVSPPLKRIALRPGTYRVAIRNPNAPAHVFKLTVTSGQAAAISHRFSAR